MNPQQIEKGMLVLVWIGGRANDKDPYLMRVKEAPFSHNGKDYWVRVGNKITAPLPVEWLTEVNESLIPQWNDIHPLMQQTLKLQRNEEEYLSGLIYQSVKNKDTVKDRGALKLMPEKCIILCGILEQADTVYQRLNCAGYSHYFNEETTMGYSILVEGHQYRLIAPGLIEELGHPLIRFSELDQYL